MQLTLSGADVRTQSVGILIPKHRGDFTNFFPRTFPLKIKFNHSVSWRESIETHVLVWCIRKHNTCNVVPLMTFT